MYQFSHGRARAPEEMYRPLSKDKTASTVRTGSFLQSEDDLPPRLPAFKCSGTIELSSDPKAIRAQKLSSVDMQRKASREPEAKIRLPVHPGSNQVRRQTKCTTPPHLWQGHRSCYCVGPTRQSSATAWRPPRCRLSWRSADPFSRWKPAQQGPMDQVRPKVVLDQVSISYPSHACSCLP